MTSAQRFTTQNAQVVHEIIDGETIIFNLENGIYYSLTGSGTEVWMMLEHGGTVGEVAAEVANYYGVPHADVEPLVAALVHQLSQEALIVPVSATAIDAAPSLTMNTGPRHAFAAPLLKKYDDMQDLLLIDPVHDVEEQQGWPALKAQVV